MADLLQGAVEGTYAPKQVAAVDAGQFSDLVAQYARQHTQGFVANSSASPYVGENMHADDGRVYRVSSSAGGLLPRRASSSSSLRGNSKN